MDEHEKARQAWATKPVVRTIYQHMHRALLNETVPGRILEVGGGAGFLKESCPQAICLDLLESAGCDLVADAEQLPFADRSMNNIVMVDVLHHLPVPKNFFREAARVLTPGGRLAIIEPAITTMSYPFYRYVHPEPLDLAVDPLSDSPLSSAHAYDANQAIPTLLVTRDRSRMAAMFPQLALTKVSWFSVLAYPASGGLRRWSLISDGFARRLLSWEERLPDWFLKKAAFRVLIVFEVR